MNCQSCDKPNAHFTGSSKSYGPDPSDAINTPENLPGGYAWLCDDCLNAISALSAALDEMITATKDDDFVRCELCGDLIDVDGNCINIECEYYHRVETPEFPQGEFPNGDPCTTPTDPDLYSHDRNCSCPNCNGEPPDVDPMSDHERATLQAEVERWFKSGLTDLQIVDRLRRTNHLPLADAWSIAGGVIDDLHNRAFQYWWN